MAANSKIEWTDQTWNPVRGCTRVSPGCGGPGDNGGCYAEAMAARFSKPGQWGHGFAEMKAGKPRWTGKVALIEQQLMLPLSWRDPKKVFVNSTSDLFHESLPDSAIDQVFAVMALCPQHDMQILTKRTSRMRAYLSESKATRRIYIEADLMAFDRRLHGPFTYCMDGVVRWPLPNVWIGTSCERQPEADDRIPQLLQTPAAIRFVSFEPLLGGIDARRVNGSINALEGSATFPPLDWVIVGGESGPGARPMHPQWARDIRDQCIATSVPFFYKQTGAWSPDPPPSDEEYPGLSCDVTHHAIKGVPGYGSTMFKVGKKAAGRLLDGKEWNQFPKTKQTQPASAPVPSLTSNLLTPADA